MPYQSQKKLKVILNDQYKKSNHRIKLVLDNLSLHLLKKEGLFVGENGSGKQHYSNVLLVENTMAISFCSYGKPKNFWVIFKPRAYFFLK
jgi:ABC-type microcin C transport system duplicated ATPase subunit YejF